VMGTAHLQDGMQATSAEMRTDSPETQRRL
jgi:hypothetical protein